MRRSIIALSFSAEIIGILSDVLRPLTKDSRPRINMTADYHLPTLTIRPLQAGASAETAASRDVDATWRVFLSSTIGDLEDYRRQVQDALQGADMACFLSEDWVNSYHCTEQVCQEQLKKANGYIGIFAYLYGSVPKGRNQSYTHLEFIWAQEKWKEVKSPPIAVLMPKSQSDAEDDLKKKAASLIPAGEGEKHAELLKNFHAEVTQAGRTVTYFKDQQQLREWVIILSMGWSKREPMAVAKGTLDVIEKNVSAIQVADEQWGLLGRQRHFEVFEKALSRAGFYPDVPAMVMVAHGDEEDAGQRVFTQQLLTRKHLNRGRPARAAYGRPPSEQYDVRALMQWVGESLGVLSKGTEAGSVEELAGLIFNELQNQQVCFVLDQVHRLIGGLSTFYENFWQPLYLQLAALRKQFRQQKPQENLERLIAVVVDYVDQSGLPDTIARDAGKAASADDYSRLLRLPVLNDISDEDLMDWFEELEIPDSADGRRARLVRIARSSASGGEDGTPLRVFERLRKEPLWPEGET